MPVPSTGEGAQVLSPTARAFLLVLATRVVPPATALSPERREKFLGIVEWALGNRPASVQRLFRLFLFVVRWLPVLRWGRRFDGLGPERQDRFLAWLEDSPVHAVRSGFWGLKTLLFMGHYGQPECHPEIGYTPSPQAGNERLHART